MELLTAILLTYNHEHTIAKALDSILEQKTNFDFQIFVLEDHSTDGTAQICKQYGKIFPGKIKLFLNEDNLGVVQNFKQGLLQVQSKYFSFLEGDDYWCDCSKLQKQVDAMEQNPDCMICGHNTLYRDLQNQRERLFVNESKFNKKSRYTLNDELRPHPSSRVYRNSIDLRDVPANMLFDTRIYLLYLSKGDLYYLPEVLSVFNSTGTGFWTGRSKKERKLMSLDLNYQTNKFFGFAYDYRFCRDVNYLKLLKIVFGVERGWELYYYLEKIRLRLVYLGRR